MFRLEIILNNLLNIPSQKLNPEIPENKLCQNFLKHQQLTYQEALSYTCSTQNCQKAEVLSKI